MTKIILATTSPYRIEAFKSLGLDFVYESSGVNEYVATRPSSPKELVLFLARLKAEKVAKRHSKGIIIGFDSVGWFNGQILEKPKSREEAFKRLMMLSGKEHQHYTGIYMKNLESGKQAERAIITKIEMRNLTQQDINKYLDQDPSYLTRALGYSPSTHYSSSFIKKIEGNFNDLITGLAPDAVIEMLSEVGYEFY